MDKLCFFPINWFRYVPGLGCEEAARSVRLLGEEMTGRGNSGWGDVSRRRVREWRREKERRNLVRTSARSREVQNSSARSREVQAG